MQLYKTSPERTGSCSQLLFCAFTLCPCKFVNSCESLLCTAGVGAGGCVETVT